MCSSVTVYDIMTVWLYCVIVVTVGLYGYVTVYDVTTDWLYCVIC